ncbi:MAG: cyclic nucleotide-binding domain-containing protein [Deltaproteobacteria bacterium]|nr:cyclic nucleotide-binding domain-containing protein [Deltaproteobacteria bacterium]
MDQVNSLAEQARRAQASGRPQQALNIYFELARLEPRSASWPREAAACFKALGDLPRYVEALNRAATLYAASGLGLKAIVALKAALSAAPGHQPTTDFLERLERATSDPRARPPVRGTPSVPPATPVLQGTVVSMFRATTPPPAVPPKTGVRELDLGWGSDGHVDPATVSGEGTSLRLIDFEEPDMARSAPPPRATTPMSGVADWPPRDLDMRPGAPFPAAGTPFAAPLVGAPVDTKASAAPAAPAAWPSANAPHVTTVRGSPLDKFWELVERNPTDIEAHRRFVAFAQQSSHEAEAIARYTALLERRPELQASVRAFELELRGLGPAGATARGKAAQDWPPLPPGVQEVYGAKTPGQLPPIPLFSALGPKVFQAVLDHSRILELHGGDILFRQGATGTSLFVVIEGSVEVVREDPPRAVVSRIGEGEFFGEISLFTDRPRGATIQAAGERTQLLEISREVVEDIARKHTEVLSVLMSFCRERMVNVLVRNHPLFQRFSPDDRMSLARRFRFVDVADNARIIEEGKPGPGLFIIVDGTLNVVSGTSNLLAILESGAMCGEISLVKRRPATANVVSSGRSMALFLPAEEFQTVVMGHPELLRYATEIADQRLKEVDDDLAGLSLEMI